MHIGPILRAMKHNRTRVVLIVLEIAMTLAIVTNCVNVILSERRKMTQTSGFDDDNIVRLRVRPFTPEFRESAFLDTIIDADIRTIQSIPGVKAVANTHFQLWEGGGSSTGVRATDVVTAPRSSQIYYATKDIVDALGAKISAGRAFRDGDHGVGPAIDPADKVIITKALADDLFPGQNPVGRSIVEALEDSTPLGEPRTVIGVMEEFYNPWGIGAGNHDTLATRAMFLPARTGSYSGGIRYLIRTEPGAMSSVITEVERRLTAANAGRVFEFTRTDEKRGRWFSSSKIVVTTMTCIIVALIAVTALGILGLTALAVSERTKQIGTRRALGATRADIVRHFLLENWILTTAGLVLGVFGAYALNVFLVSRVTDTKLPWELVAAGVVLLWINGLLATVPPAFRATLINPAIATKSV